jgi:hypothetical protein
MDAVQYMEVYIYVLRIYVWFTEVLIYVRIFAMLPHDYQGVSQLEGEIISNLTH